MIAELKPGGIVTDFFVVRNKDLRSKKSSGSVYLSLELGDSSGRIFGSVWTNPEDNFEIIKIGGLVKIHAKVIDWKGRTHLSIDKIRLAVEDDEQNLEDFLPKAETNPKQLSKDFFKFVKTIKNAHLKELLDSIFIDTKTWDKYVQAPGGKLWHHNYSGGLLEHTCSMANLAEHLCKHYKTLDRDLLIASVLLHDIGKVDEFKQAGFWDYSDEGRLHGHIAIGYHIVASHIDKIDSFPKQLRDELLHMILAHQGEREKGSPVVPMTREAFVLNFLDELDSKLNAFERIFERDHELDGSWSKYVNLLDRYLFLGNE